MPDFIDRLFWLPAVFVSHVMAFVVNDMWHSRRAMAIFRLDAWEEDGGAFLAFTCLLVWLSLEYALARLILIL